MLSCKPVTEQAGLCTDSALSQRQQGVRVLLHRARLKLFQVVEHYQETGEC